MSGALDWRSLNRGDSAVSESGDGRFVIATGETPRFNFWLTDRASNFPPNPPKGFMTEDDAQRHAEGLVARGERL